MRLALKLALALVAGVVVIVAAYKVRHSPYFVHATMASIAGLVVIALGFITGLISFVRLESAARMVLGIVLTFVCAMSVQLLWQQVGTFDVLWTAVLKLQVEGPTSGLLILSAMCFGGIVAMAMSISDYVDRCYDVHILP